jgi:adenosylhomocysteine nucleosidase
VLRAAIIVALELELAPYRALLPDLERADDGIWPRWITADCGPINAVAATERTITTFQPDLVLNTGSAGAHNPELLPGDLVVGDRYTLLSDPLYPSRSLGLCWQADDARVERGGIPADPGLVARGLQAATAVCAGASGWSDALVWPAGVPARPPLAVAGTIGSTDTWNTDAGRIDRLWASASSLSEDMESAYMAQVCALHSLPFLAIRCISNAERHAGTARLGVSDILSALTRAGELAAQTVCAFLRLEEIASA